jgi:diguanylate cyclase (GGDEF)-like protein/PAS domain S-box-containing protein
MQEHRGNGSLGSLFDLPRFLFLARRHTFRQYVFVSAFMGFALLARLLIAPLDGGIQYVTFFPAVAISAVVCGFWPGLFAAAVGVSMATYLFWPPYGALTFDFGHQTVMSNTVFLIDAVLVCTAIEAMHRYYQRFADAQEELRLAASVFRSSAEGIVVTDGNSIILSVNPAFSEITGYSAVEAVGKTVNLLRSNRHDAAFYRSMWSDLNDKGCWQGEIWNRRKNGEAYLEWLTINRVTDGDSMLTRYVGVFHDITEMRLKDEHIRHLAFHDALTGLPNRLILQDRLHHAIERARRTGDRLALVFVDLDHFKAVNDNLGHDIGDLLLQEIGLRIKDRLRASDTAVRLGGDEFVILMEGQHEDSLYPRLAEELITDICRPLELNGHVVQVGASVGIAFFPADAGDADELIKHACRCGDVCRQVRRPQYLQLVCLAQ